MAGMKFGCGSSVVIASRWAVKIAQGWPRGVSVTPFSRRLSIPLFHAFQPLVNRFSPLPWALHTATRFVLVSSCLSLISDNSCLLLFMIYYTCAPKVPACLGPKTVRPLAVWRANLFPRLWPIARNVVLCAVVVSFGSEREASNESHPVANGQQPRQLGGRCSAVGHGYP